MYVFGTKKNDGCTELTCTEMHFEFTTKIVDFNNVDSIACHWTNSQQYKVMYENKSNEALETARAKDEFFDDKCAVLYNSIHADYEDTDRFIRACAIGAKWTSLPFNCPDWFTNVLDAMKTLHENVTDENRTALKKVVNEKFTLLAEGHVVDTFKFNLSGAQAEKMMNACYPLAVKHDRKTGKTFTVESRLNAQACYQLFCRRFIQLLGIYKEPTVKDIAFDA